MKFAIIGLDAPNTFSVKMQKALTKLGHSVYFLPFQEINRRYCDSAFKRHYHINMKKPIDLASILPIDHYDIVIVSHIPFVFYNSNRGSTKFLYYHREYLDYPSAINPDIIAYNLPCHDEWMRQNAPSLYYTPVKINLTIAVDPEEWNPSREKDLKGLNYVSCYEDIMAEKRDYAWSQLYGEFLDREKRFTANGCRINGGRYVDTPELKDYIERSEEFLQFMPPGIFASRRLLECSVSKTLPIIYIESKASLDYHEDLGFEHRENCMMFNDKPLFESEYDIERLVNNAYDLVLGRHTYNHRAKQILELLQ